MHTGNTVTRTVASNATISEMKLRLIMTSNSFLDGFHSEGTTASALASISELILDPRDK